MYGIFWKTTDGRQFFQSILPETSDDWGHYSMYINSSHLCSALTKDKLVEMVVDWQEYGATVYKNGKTLDDEEEYLAEIKELIPKMKAIYDNDIAVELVEEMYGSCELCFYKGTHEFFSLKNGKIVKKEIKSV